MSLRLAEATTKNVKLHNRSCGNAIEAMGINKGHENTQSIRKGFI